MSPDLSLVVQYATPAPDLPRWRLRRWVRQAVIAAADHTPGRFQAASLTLRLVDTDEARRLNHEFRQKDYATNVLTFEYGVDRDGMASGDIVLCLPVMQREATEQGKTVLDHAAHLTIHGVLHALGHDHIEPDEATEMETLETDILRKMCIADPYRITAG